MHSIQLLFKAIVLNYKTARLKSSYKGKNYLKIVKHIDALSAFLRTTPS